MLCHIWCTYKCQNLNAVGRIVIQQGVLRIMNVWTRGSHQVLYSNSTIFWNLEINKSINNLLPQFYNGWSTLCFDIQNHEAVSSATGKIFKPSRRTDSYWKNSVTIVVINYLNKTQFFSLIMKIKSLKSKVLSLKIHGKTLLKEF